MQEVRVDLDAALTIIMEVQKPACVHHSVHAHDVVVLLRNLVAVLWVIASPGVVTKAGDSDTELAAGVRGG